LLKIAACHLRGGSACFSTNALPTKALPLIVETGKVRPQTAPFEKCYA
jgi:hypothetical protein